MLTSETASVFFNLLRAPSCCFVWMRRYKWFNITPKTTGMEDTYRTLTAIPFQVGVNNSLMFLSLQAYEKIFPSFHSCIFLIPCTYSHIILKSYYVGLITLNDSLTTYSNIIFTSYNIGLITPNNSLTTYSNIILILTGGNSSNF